MLHLKESILELHSEMTLLKVAEILKVHMLALAWSSSCST